MVINESILRYLSKRILTTASLTKKCLYNLDTHFNAGTKETRGSLVLMLISLQTL